MQPTGFLREHSSILLWVMRFLDCIILLATCSFAYLIVFGVTPLPAHYQVAIIFSVLLLIMIFHAYSLYRTWRGVDYTQEVTAIIIAWTTVFAVLVFLSVITKSSAQFSRAWLLLWYTFGGATLLITRYVLRRALQYLRSRGYNLRHIVIIASGKVGRHVFRTLSEAPETGFNIKAYFSDDAEDSSILGNAEHHR